MVQRKSDFGTGGAGIGGSPVPPSRGAGSTVAISSNPQLLTSTGGLQGSLGALLTPVNINQIPGPSSYVMIHDANNFDTEEDCIYYFREEVGSEYEGQYIQISKIIIKYRELGKAKFFIGISAYQQKTDSFKVVETEVSIPSVKLSKDRLKNFPDKKIHIINIAPPKGVIQGINPQVYIRRVANSGPLSITKLVACGYSDEVPQI